MSSHVRFAMRIVAALFVLTLVTLAMVPAPAKHSPYASALSDLTVGTARAGECNNTWCVLIRCIPAEGFNCTRIGARCITDNFCPD
jgi:hypothetical protein